VPAVNAMRYPPRAKRLPRTLYAARTMRYAVTPYAVRGTHHALCGYAVRCRRHAARGMHYAAESHRARPPASARQRRETGRCRGTALANDLFGAEVGLAASCVSDHGQYVRLGHCAPVVRRLTLLSVVSAADECLQINSAADHASAAADATARFSSCRIFCCDERMFY
jgi:hypothetical protein